MIILSFQSIFLAIVISEMCMKKIGVFAQPLINPPILVLSKLLILHKNKEDLVAYAAPAALSC